MDATYLRPHFSPGKKSKVKGEVAGDALTENAAVPIALGNILDTFLKLSAAEITSNGGRGVKATLFDSQRIVLIEIVAVY